MATAVPVANLIVITFDKRRKKDRAALPIPTSPRIPMRCMGPLIFHRHRASVGTEDTNDIGHTRQSTCHSIPHCGCGCRTDNSGQRPAVPTRRAALPKSQWQSAASGRGPALVFLTERVPWFVMTAANIGLAMHLEKRLGRPTFLLIAATCDVRDRHSMVALGIPRSSAPYSGLAMVLRE